MERSYITKDVANLILAQIHDGMTLRAFLRACKWTHGLIDVRIKEYTMGDQPYYIILPGGHVHGLIAIRCAQCQFAHLTYSYFGAPFRCEVRIYTIAPLQIDHRISSFIGYLISSVPNTLRVLIYPHIKIAQWTKQSTNTWIKVWADGVLSHHYIYETKTIIKGDVAFI